MSEELLPRGIIVSIQGYRAQTMSELAQEAINGGAVGIRTDKSLRLDGGKSVPIIGLHKTDVVDVKTEAYITPTVEEVRSVQGWANLVAIDYRSLNPNLQKVSRYCRERKLLVVADIETYEDFENLCDHGFYYTYVATTLAVFRLPFRPNLRLVEKIGKRERNLIAEGNFSSRRDVQDAFECGAHAVCIGGAISNVYKLTRRYTRPWAGPTLAENGQLEKQVNA